MVYNNFFFKKKIKKKKGSAWAILVAASNLNSSSADSADGQSKDSCDHEGEHWYVRREKASSGSLSPYLAANGEEDAEAEDGANRPDGNQY